jgi:hypothetical protein
MRNVIIAVVGFMLGSAFFQYVNHAHSAEAPKKEELPCASNKDIEKIMNDKGYALLLNMTRKEDNKEGVIETVWIGGENIVVTATVPKGETSCLIANMGNVIVNPNAIEEIWENYKKQTKQKDI